MTFDDRTEKNLATLVPVAQERARQFMTAVLRTGIDAKIISGTRTFREQDALYAQGRTQAGKRVTNARAGYSWHNWGLAWDIGIFSNGKYLEESPLYVQAGKIGEILGLEWGGSWKTIVDEPHYQVRPDYLKGLKDSECFAILMKRFKSGEPIL